MTIFIYSRKNPRLGSASVHVSVVRSDDGLTTETSPLTLALFVRGLFVGIKISHLRIYGFFIDSVHVI